MDTRNYILLPGIPNFANLVVFPMDQNVCVFILAKAIFFYLYHLQGASSLYIMGTTVPRLVKAEHSVQVELLPNHAYCLLPSVGMNFGSWRLHTVKPDFIDEIPFCMFLGKVRLFIHN